GIRMRHVTPEQTIVTESPAAGLHYPGINWKVRDTLRRQKINLQSRFPGLRAAVGIVDHLGARREPIEIVPFRLEQTDRSLRVQPQRDATHVSALALDT